MNLLRAITTVGSLTLLSRILGFVRDILMATVMGAGLVADCFLVAFKLPNFFRRLFAEGAFSAGFVPLFSEKLEASGAGDAKRFAEESLAGLLAALAIFVSLAQVAMPVLMYALAPGFAENPVKFDLAIQLTRLTFPYLLFISLVSLMGGVLNALGRFAAVAAAPILLNLTLIGALLILADRMDTPGHALALGVSVAGMIQFLWLLAALRREGIGLRLGWPRLTDDVKRLLLLMAPVALGAGVAQINLVVDVILASLLPEGSVTYLYFADRLTQLPIGVVGVAVGTVLLPLLSRQVTQEEAGDQSADASASQAQAIEIALLLTLPAAAALMVIPAPLIGTLFQYGAFDAQATLATANALAAYGIGVPAFVLIKVLTPGFFARKDTRTPMLIAVVALLANIVLNLILMGPLLHAGLALASSISGWLNVTILAIVLGRRGHLRLPRRTLVRVAKIVAASALMAVGLWFAGDALAGVYASGIGGRVMTVAALVVPGAALFGLIGLLIGAFNVRELRTLWRPETAEHLDKGTGALG